MTMSGSRCGARRRMYLIAHEASAFVLGLTEGVADPFLTMMEHTDIEVAAEFLAQAVVVRVVDACICHIGRLPASLQHPRGHVHILAEDCMHGETVNGLHGLPAVCRKGVRAEGRLHAMLHAVGEGIAMPMRWIVECARMGSKEICLRMRQLTAIGTADLRVIKGLHEMHDGMGVCGNRILREEYMDLCSSRMLDALLACAAVVELRGIDTDHLGMELLRLMPPYVLLRPGIEDQNGEISRGLLGQGAQAGMKFCCGMIYRNNDLYPAHAAT